MALHAFHEIDANRVLIVLVVILFLSLWLLYRTLFVLLPGLDQAAEFNLI